MKIILVSDERIRLEGDPGGLSIEAESHDRAYTPFHMVASGLASCLFSVLDSWAEHAKLDTGDLAIEISWEFVDEPHRIGSYDVSIEWPSLPEARRNAAAHTAALCPIHATLEHPPTINVQVVKG